MKRHELTDDQWALLSEFFPPRRPRRGGQWTDDRLLLNGICWRLNTGAPWRDLPQRYGPWQTVYDRFNQMRHSGLLDRIRARLPLPLNEAGRIDPALLGDAATDAGDANPTKKITTPDRQGEATTRLQAVRARFARNEGLPFADVLTQASI